MTNLREAVSTALCRTYFAHDYEGEELERIVDNERMDWLDEADAAIAVVLQALKEPSQLMLDAAVYALPGVTKEQNEQAERDAWRLYRTMIDAFTRDHYLSALAEEDGKEL